MQLPLQVDAGRYGRQQQGRFGGIADGAPGLARRAVVIEPGVGAEGCPQQQQLLGRTSLGRCRGGSGGPGGLHGHAVGGQGAGFVGANHTDGAQGFHRREATHQGVVAGHALHRQGQGQGDRGQQALGHEGHDDADGKHQAFLATDADEQPAGQKGEGAHGQGHRGDRAHDPGHLQFQGAGRAHGGGREVGHLAKLGFGAGGIDQGRGPPGRHGGAGRQQVAGLAGF